MEESSTIVGAIKIKDGLFIGDRYAAQDLEFAITHKVTHVINCAGPSIINVWEQIGVMYLTFPWTESDFQVNDIQMIVLFDEEDEVLNEIVKFIDEAVEAGESTLIHSIQGQSRSCCVLVAYFMRKYNWALLKSLEFLNSRRPGLEIRANFFQQLTSLELKLQLSRQGAMITNWNSQLNDIQSSDELIIRNTYLNSRTGQIADIFTNDSVHQQMLRKDKRDRLTWNDIHHKRELHFTFFPTSDSFNPLLHYKETQQQKRYLRSCLKGSQKHHQRVGSEGQLKRIQQQLQPKISFARSMSGKQIVGAQSNPSKPNKGSQSLVEEISNSLIENKYSSTQDMNLFPLPKNPTSNSDSSSSRQPYQFDRLSNISVLQNTKDSMISQQSRFGSDLNDSRINESFLKNGVQSQSNVEESFLTSSSINKSNQLLSSFQNVLPQQQIEIKQQGQTFDNLSYLNNSLSTGEKRKQSVSPLQSMISQTEKGSSILNQQNQQISSNISRNNSFKTIDQINSEQQPLNSKGQSITKKIKNSIQSFLNPSQEKNSLGDSKGAYSQNSNNMRQNNSFGSLLDIGLTQSNSSSLIKSNSPTYTFITGQRSSSLTKANEEDHQKSSIQQSQTVATLNQYKIDNSISQLQEQSRYISERNIKSPKLNSQLLSSSSAQSIQKSSSQIFETANQQSDGIKLRGNMSNSISNEQLLQKKAAENSSLKNFGYIKSIERPPLKARDTNAFSATMASVNSSLSKNTLNTLNESSSFSQLESNSSLKYLSTLGEDPNLNRSNQNNHLFNFGGLNSAASMKQIGIPRPPKPKQTFMMEYDKSCKENFDPLQMGNQYNPMKNNFIDGQKPNGNSKLTSVIPSKVSSYRSFSPIPETNSSLKSKLPDQRQILQTKHRIRSNSPASGVNTNNSTYISQSQIGNTNRSISPYLGSQSNSIRYGNIMPGFGQENIFTVDGTESSSKLSFSSKPRWKF